jgi:hypothetical protein
MKTIILSKTLIRYILYYTSLALLICSPTLSQSSENSIKDKNMLKTELKIEEGIHSLGKNKKVNNLGGINVIKKSVNESTETKLIDVRVHKIVDMTGTNDRTDHSAKEDKIEVIIDAGKKKAQTLTIQNSGDSPLIWNISPEGSEKLHYRLYVKDRDLLKLTNIGEKESNDLLSSEVFHAKETTLKIINSEIHNTNSEVSLIKLNIHRQKQQNKADDFVNSINDVPSSELYDKVELSNQQSVSKTKTTKEHSDFKIDNFDDRAPDFSGVVEFSNRKEMFRDKVNGINFRNQIKVFQQWYSFADCGYPKFDPQIKVWEVSQDNGVHWKQILLINGERYVVNARCFNPVEFLEHHSMEDRKSPYSKLTTLPEFVKQVQRGPAFYPRSGIIPAKTSEKIELSVDASSIESGTYDPHLVFIDSGTMEKVSVVPLHFKVVSELEKVPPQQLQKQTLGEQLPDEFELLQNYPNPFNPSTQIKYSVPANGLVKLSVFNLIGEEITVLVNEVVDAGFYGVAFNAANLPSGIYFYRLQTGKIVKTKKMVLMK